LNNLNREDLDSINNRINIFKDLISTRASDSSHEELGEYFEAVGKIRYCNLLTKVAYTTLHKSATDNGVQDELQWFYNRLYLMFTNKEQEVLIDIIDSTISTYRDSSLGMSLVRTGKPDNDKISGQIQDVKALLIDEPWYFVTVLSVI